MALRLTILILLLVGHGRCLAAEENWQPAKGPLMTRWAKDVSPKNAHPDYPRPNIDDTGLSAAVYAQTTDVEVEVNGLMTYDRALVKMDTAQVAAENQSIE